MCPHPHDQYVGINFFLTIAFERWAATCTHMGVRPVIKGA
ncbi:hypothetical protein B0G77_4910 [Paraburkholderia sp. BL10I2N1]|nr:hypothetical protein B0G77_4910 [Paraburkholderia sp. BL10I2N1]